MSKPRYIIAAGGTGGHFFPAQALAQELSRRGGHVEFMTDSRGLNYRESLPVEQIYEIPSASLSLKPKWSNVLGIIRIIRGVVKSIGLIRKCRPDLIIGFGGYPSVPPLLAARFLRVPIILHEQNTVMGRANRLFARRALAIASGFATINNLDYDTIIKVIPIGSPVRDEVMALEKSPYKVPSSKEDFNLLIFGGSQGASVFSEILPKAIAGLPDNERKKIKIVQQCRQEDIEEVRGIYQKSGIDFELKSFFDDMPEQMRKAHLVISRSGASTISELTMIGRPAILVPYPHSLDNDQLYNAKFFVELKCGWLIEQKDFTVEKLSGILLELKQAPDELATAAAAAGEIGKPNAVKSLVELAEIIAIVDEEEPDSGQNKKHIRKQL